MRSLLIDTAGPVVGVAAFAGELCLGAHSLRQSAGTDGWLTPRIAALLGALGGLDRVAVTVGPGAFTGIRVGVAAALGLAVARRVPVVPLSSLALRAALLPGHPQVLVVLDARKGRVYAGRFDTRGPVPVAVGAEADVSPEVAAAGEPAWVVGEGALVYRGLLEAAGHHINDDPGASPVEAGQKLVHASTGVPADQVLLHYLREPDAQLPRV